MSAKARPAGTAFAANRAGRGALVHQLMPDLKTACGDELGLCSSDPSEVDCPPCIVTLSLWFFEVVMTRVYGP